MVACRLPIGSQTKVMLGMVGWLIATGSTEKQAMSSPWRGFAVAWGCSLVISEPLVSSVTLPWERDPARPTPERQPPPARAEGGVRFFKAGEAIRTPGIHVGDVRTPALHLVEPSGTRRPRSGAAGVDSKARRPNRGPGVVIEVSGGLNLVGGGSRGRRDRAARRLRERVSGP